MQVDTLRQQTMQNAGLLAGCLVFILLLTFEKAGAQESLGAAASDAGVQLFEKQIRPVLIQRCYSCHSSRAGKSEGELTLDVRSVDAMQGSRGLAIVSGQPDHSLLMKAIRYQDADFQMPPTERLTNEEVAAFEAWIRLGAPIPETPTAVDDPSDPEIGRSHWAFQPLSDAVPVPENPDWCRSPIDQFVLARLEREGLRPVNDASPRDFLRRLSFQLVGLPPSAEHMSQYLANPSEETRARIVDELLASPQFGERWGRHWLDLARYADSNGLDENFLFREAWRYRNWVIGAVNADLPFDRFLLEQLAGDLLPWDSIEQRDRQRIAAGFLVVGPKVLLGVNPQRQRMDVADEQLETIGRVVLGQTLGCARCHDHKFDPIPTRDYYAMAGILTSTSVMEQRYMLGEQRVMEQLIGLGENGEVVDNAYEQYWRNRPALKTRMEKVKAVLELFRQQKTEAIAEQLRVDAESFADGAKDPGIAIEQRLAAQESLARELTEALEKPPGIPPRAMTPVDAGEIGNEAIRLAGKFDQPGDKVPRGFLTVLCRQGAAPMSLPETQSGRIELAQWLTARGTPAGWLTARVQANRIWHHLIGRGLVRTVDNFGRTGELPSHPELLDHLAQQLMDDQWSFKSLIRRIVLSHTFALSTQHSETNWAVDPENLLLWRANRRRLDPESLRDAILTAAGTLDLKPMDSTVSYLGDQATAVGNNAVRRRTDFSCRSVYLPVIRNDLPELFEVFDFANPQMATGARPKTTVPTQALFLMNDEMVMTCAETTARRVLAESAATTPETGIARMFELITSGPPTDNEVEAFRTYLQQTAVSLRESGTTEPELQALAQACHALFASSRFQFLE